MRNNSHIQRILSALLALIMMLTLCACDTSRPSATGETRRPVEETRRPAEEAQDGTADSADDCMHEDQVITDHAKHNEELSVAPVPEREAEEFHMYIPSTETLNGFVTANRVTAYQESIQCVVDTAGNLFARMYGHSLDYAEHSSDLTWVEAELDERFTRKVQSPDFYEGKPLPLGGALPALFKGATPFEEEGLTVIVSNFVEPGFDVSCLAAGIEEYFDSYPKSGACIIGFYSNFDGNFHIPSYEMKDRSTYYISNFEGEVPCYILMVGPLEEVAEYAEQLFGRLDNRKIEYFYEHYSNNVYEEHFADKLVFDIIPDVGECKITLPVLESYNTGNLTERKTGNAYFATSCGAVTRDQSTRGNENGISVAKSTQISLISTNYDGESQYSAEPTLYIWDQTTGTWAEASKNDFAMVHFTMEPKSGALEGVAGTVLSAGRKEMYVSVQMDFGENSTLSRDHVYRLEVKVRLNQDSSSGPVDHSKSRLFDWSISSQEYFSVKDDMCKIFNDNYIWTGTDADVREKATGFFRCTPNLDSLLISLGELEGKYNIHTEKYTYLDFVFNIKDGGSTR